MMPNFLPTDSELVSFVWECSAKTAILILIIALLMQFFRRSSASWRHAVWASTLVGATALPMLMMLLPDWQLLPTIQYEDSIQNSTWRVGAPYPMDADSKKDEAFTSAMTGPSSTDRLENKYTNPNQLEWSRASVPTSVENLERVLVTIWGLGLLASLLPMVLSLITLKRLGGNSESFAESKLESKVSLLSKQLEIRKPTLIVGTDFQMPMVWGLGTTYLLLPGAYQSWGAEKLDAVLLHELAHLRRRDPLMQLFGQGVRALLWFNPMIWFALIKMRTEQEIACDDFVVCSGLHPDRYASHLLELSTGLNTSWRHGVVALSMATKTKIEFRLQQILNPGLNRSPLNKTTCFSSVVIVSLLVCFFGVLGFESEVLASDEESRIEWPFCELNIANLDERSFEEAVNQFNEKAKTSPIGSTQPPISVTELENSIRTALEDGNTSEKQKRRLEDILDRKVLPANVYLRRFTRFDDGEMMHGVWWVRLVVDSKNLKHDAITVRAAHLYARPFTLLERKQIADRTLTLLNRTSSYYESLPKLSNEKPDKSAIEFANKIKEMLEAGDKEQILKRFNWNKVSGQVKEFATSEINQIAAAQIESVKFVPLAWEGELITWQAFQRLKPNLPLIGHIRIKYQNRSTRKIDRKDLEIGRNSKGKVFFVGYTVERRVPMPKSIAVPLSIESQTFMRKEKQPEKTNTEVERPYYITWQIKNPDKLVSAHLANEEIWLRESNPEKSPLEIGSTELVVGTADPKLVKNVVWGKSQNGLKAAVVLEKIADQSAFTLFYFVMNVSDREIRIDSERWRQNDRFRVWTADAEKLEITTKSMWYTGWPTIQTHVLKPGQYTKLSSGKLNIGPEYVSQKELTAEPYGVGVGPGRYLIQFSLNIPGFQLNNDHWQGQLETGTTPFEIK